VQVKKYLGKFIYLLQTRNGLYHERQSKQTQVKTTYYKLG